jgi:hypothetical protein
MEAINMVAIGLLIYAKWKKVSNVKFTSCDTPKVNTPNRIPLFALTLFRTTILKLVIVPKIPPKAQYNMKGCGRG